MQFIYCKEMEKCENLSTYCEINAINLLVKVNLWLEYAYEPDEPYATFFVVFIELRTYFELN